MVVTVLFDIFISFYIIFHKFLEFHSELSKKKIFVTHFPFLANSLPPSLMAKICEVWQVFC